jgi:hypothetical protein
MTSEVKWRDFEMLEKQVFTGKGLGKCSVKWSEVKGFWSTEEIEYFQEQGLESDKWSEVKGIEVGWRSAKCDEGKAIKAGWDVKCI